MILPVTSQAAKAINLTVGERYSINHIKSHIWIEDPKVIKTNKPKSPKFLVAQKIGSTQVRLDGTLYRFNVNPSALQSSVSFWKNIDQKFSQIYLADCFGLQCLKGKITEIQEFEKLVNLSKKQQSIFFAFQLGEKVKPFVESWYESYQRKMGLSPVKINFSSPWTISLSKDYQDPLKKEQFLKVGLLVDESKSILTIEDNIEVQIEIVEIKSELLRTLGIKWPNQYTAQLIDGKLLQKEALDISAEAHERSGDMKIIASPKLICRNGKSAEFFAGGEFPIKTFSENFGSVQWKRYGISLNIKPIVDPLGQMSIAIETEISSIDKSREVDGIPALHSHKVTSHFDLLESKTIILSGLIKNESGLSKEGLPYLKNLPILGHLFSSRSFLENKTELIILVKPQLMEHN